MGFHKSSMDIHLKNGHVLCAYCRRPSGEAIYSELDLNEFLGTKKVAVATSLSPHPLQTLEKHPQQEIINTGPLIGKFAWSAENFSDAASDVHLEMEGQPSQPILHAQLGDGDGAHHEDCVNLADCIKNEDGHLRFMDCF
ncbi:hypothetical protein N7462_005980 [Penicillium macrosclerotiorum]|uniref:uncharacterized protein n=1 Tax=Penicillium macrosclerotiorum TaxID=303699 RepID=UPI002547043D|nr:uncharacterized protein N7462_005980 [Penicillium macrosclerotiorum]KAJ5682815.1 hypothetical protein N7462_005980 [Penicillium macrosclerotiorum]